MDSGYQVVFLGTGGGRFVTITQRRRTAGIRMMGENINLHLDPGPGALVHSISQGLDPQRLTAVLVSHCHPDHYNDAEVLIEAMTRGMTRKRGVLAAAKSVLVGSDSCEPSISRYHQQMVEHRIKVVIGSRFEVGSVKVAATEARHTDLDAVGFRFETRFGDFAYTSDTEYYDGVEKYYRNLRVLILCVMRPSGKPWKGHMSTDDAIKIIEETHPEQAVLTHLGVSMLMQSPAKEAKLIEEKTGVATVVAIDSMKVDFGETLKIRTDRARTQQGLEGFL